MGGASEPPAGWVQSTWIAVGLVAAFVTLSNVYSLLSARGAADTLVLLVASANGLVLIGLVAAVSTWARNSQALIDAFGDGRRRVMLNWGFRVLIVCVALSLYIQFTAGRDNTGAVITAAVLRSIGGLAMLAEVLVTRAHILRLVTEPPGPRGEMPPPSLVDVDLAEAQLPPSATPTADDWDASRWDPGLQAEIDRKRRR